MLKKLKNNKLLVALIILLIVFIVFVLKIVFAFTRTDNEALYGSRLDGIKDVAFEDSEMQKKVKEAGGASTKEAVVRTQGRIINVLITVTDDTGKDIAPLIAGVVMGVFSEEELKYYDIQFFMLKDTEDASYPMIGYRHHDTKKKDSDEQDLTIKWTKGR